MKTTLGHLEFNIDVRNQSYYVDLFLYLGWKILHQDDTYLGLGAENGVSVWFSERKHPRTCEPDGSGLNHIAIQTATMQEVDMVNTFLAGNNIVPLFGTPRHRPEFVSSADQTYYQVMFSSPDGILFEVVYIGRKS